MRKMMLVIIVIAMLLSGCISGANKSGRGNTGNNGDEYGIDNSVEDDDSGIVQADYSNLDINSKYSNVSNVKSTNKTINTLDNTTIKASLEIIKR